MRQGIRGNMTDGAALALDVEERNAAFGCRIKLENLRNAKAVLKAIPRFWRQAGCRMPCGSDGRSRWRMGPHAAGSGTVHRCIGTCCSPNGE